MVWLASVWEGSNSFGRIVRLWLAITIALLAVLYPVMVLAQAEPPLDHSAVSGPTAPSGISYSEFLEQVNQDQVSAVVISGAQIRGERKDGSRFVTLSPETNNSAMIRVLIERNVTVSGERPADASSAVQLGLTLLGALALVAVCLHIGPRAHQGGGENVTNLRKSPARRLNAGEVGVTFADVAGVDEAKQEVAELVDFLRDPGKFQRLGGRIPCGVLLCGAPGTGKTLLARAIAGEAGVPFFAISGSDFVEMYVGVGASRVRDLFDQAEQNAPCIVFIDEIDAVGRRRGAGPDAGPGEREQTLNQLLVRMDGIEGNKDVIVIAATNRPDVLDPALLRPGRFDRQVVVPLPDVRGREQIVRVHMRGVPLAEDVDPAIIARAAPGFSGADLANLVNEAALFAARAGKQCVGPADFAQARDKILMGTERRSLVMSHADKEVTAYHEAGHALVGLHVPDHDPLEKVSIVPRGRALGVTLFLPQADRCSETRQSLNSRICALLGGRAAEELNFGAEHITTNAANDLAQTTEIARNMVVRYGMSDELGPLTYTDDRSFPGRGGAAQLRILPTGTARAIDLEVRAIVERNYARARSILVIHLETLHRLAEALIEHETIDRAQLDAILRTAAVPATGTCPASLRPRAGGASGGRAAAFHA